MLRPLDAATAESIAIQYKPGPLQFSLQDVIVSNRSYFGEDALHGDLFEVHDNPQIRTRKICYAKHSCDYDASSSCVFSGRRIGVAKECCLVTDMRGVLTGSCTWDILLAASFTKRVEIEQWYWELGKDSELCHLLEFSSVL